MLALTSACGGSETTPGTGDDDTTTEESATGDDDSTESDDTDEPAPSDDTTEDDDDVAPPPTGAKDAGGPAKDAATGPAKTDGSVTKSDAGSTTTKSDGGTTTGSGSGDSGTTPSGGDASTGPTTSNPGTGSVTGGACCSDGNCICREPPPASLSSAKGKYKTASLRVSQGTIVYPTDATPPFAGVAICPGFLNTGPEMAEWGPFYASHGIVTLVTNTGAADIPEIRASKLAAAVNALKAENTKSGSPLNGKMAGRYGTSGYSMGGGGTLLTATDSKNQLYTSVGLAPWGGTGTGIKAATLLFCGDLDVVAPCSFADSAYGSIPSGTNKMMITISGCDHLTCWFGPGDAGRGTSGGYALAWQKAFLEGDERWKPPLLQKPSSASDYKTTLK